MNEDHQEMKKATFFFLSAGLTNTNVLFAREKKLNLREVFALAALSKLVSFPFYLNSFGLFIDCQASFCDTVGSGLSPKPFSALILLGVKPKIQVVTPVRLSGYRLLYCFMFIV